MATLNLNQATKSGGLKVSTPAPKAAPIQYGPTGPNQAPIQFQYNPAITNKGGSVLGASTGPTQNRAAAPAATPQNANNGFSQIQQAQDAGNQQIESDYNQSMSMLDQAQQGLQSQAAGAGAQITNDAAAAQTSLGAAQATGEQGVQSSLSTAEKQGQSAMQQARDVYRQTQQQNNAQLSALGISSSSVSEALAERLGVDVAKRIAGVTGSIDEVRTNANNELTRIKNYYSDKKTQLDENVRIQKDQIQQSLVAGLNQINAARGQAASAKSQARSSLLSQVQSQIGQLTQQQQQFDQQLQQWAAQKAAVLTPLTTNEGLQQAFQNFSNLTQSDQFKTSGLSAGMDLNAKLQPTYQFGTINTGTQTTSKAKKTTTSNDNEIRNPFDVSQP